SLRGIPARPGGSRSIVAAGYALAFTLSSSMRSTVSMPILFRRSERATPRLLTGSRRFVPIFYLKGRRSLAMTTILCAMPEPTYRRMMNPELEAQMYALGDVVLCQNAREMSEEAYSTLWERADAAVTGWGVRAPTPEILDRAKNLRIISHTAG